MRAVLPDTQHKQTRHWAAPLPSVTHTHTHPTSTRISHLVPAYPPLMSSLALSSPVLCSSLDSYPTTSYPHSSPPSFRNFDSTPARCLGKVSTVVRSLPLPSCFELASTCPKSLTVDNQYCRNVQRLHIRANAGADNVSGSASAEETSTGTSLEQGKRILALQKDLLDQIAERKKLVTALKENLGQAAEQAEAPNITETRLDESKFLEDKLVPNIAGLGSSSVMDVTSMGNSAVTAAYFDAAVNVKKATDLDIKTPSSICLATTERQSGSLSSMNKPAPPLAGPNVMNVILAAAECYPWSKTGGLGDVAGALPKALARRGHRVMVVTPRYRSYPEACEIGVRKKYKIAGQDFEVAYFHGYIDGVDHVFIDNSTFHGFANNIYGGNREDVLKRMVLFCKAAVEVPWHVPCGGVCYGDGNLAFIANDWHTALLPVYLQAYYRDNGLMNFARSILVVHNIAHQGRGPLSDFSFLGLPDHYIDKFRLYDPVGGEHCNVFMAGLLTAHRIVAVSHGYAWECQTQLGGWGLDGVVREQNWKLRGIVNGIDDKDWNPELDAHLKTDGYSNYSIQTLQTGKTLCKAALQRELDLPLRNDVPLLGFIGRLDHQKGVDIIADAMHWMMEQDLQLVLLGTGRTDLENMLRNFESQHRHKVRAWVGFSVKTAHRITAGCDILVMPSRFEPCGLNQLYAMQYGTVPVVHAVGGLRDTVTTFDPFSNTGTGWTFNKAEASELIHALGNSMWTFRDFKESWKGIQERGMAQDLSWDQAAKQYEEVMVAAKYQW